MKVKIFVDFWNLQLSWNEYHRKLGSPKTVRIPWEKILPQTLLNKMGVDSKYEGPSVPI